MFLKRISMSGFKSFADKVDFDFGTGITCIVGPNGCGKSNVVDAFKWVLGEQSAKSLRGAQMLDMIFNGSSSRRSSGMATVDLVFDNVDRSLPLDCDEITVTRKLYRSGESEYLLNKEASRLKTIREMFMDTGVGTDAYCVIEQGKVDVLLQSSPQERRSVFEEACGISKYKARKKEALRKLERTQQNLLRLADIIEEVEKRLRSVKLQAGKARNWQTYDTQLRELRSIFSLAEYHRLTVDCDKHAESGQVAEDIVTASKTRIDAGEAESLRLTTEDDRLSTALTEIEANYAQVRSQITAHQERIEAASQRAVEEDHHLIQATERLNTQRSRADELSGELSSLLEQSEQIEADIQRQNQEIDTLLESDRGLAADLTHAQALLADEKAGLIELVRRGAELGNEITKLETHCDSLVGQKGRLSERDAQINAELRSLLERKDALEERRSEIERLIEAEMQKLEEKRAEAARVHNVQADLAQEITRARELRSGLASRQQLLEDLENKMEGVGAGVRQVLAAKAEMPDDPALSTVTGMVAELFEADLVHALVVEAAVGQQDQFLVVDDSEAFLSDAARLKNLSGRLTAICLDRLPPLINPRDFSEFAGFVSRADDLVRFPEQLQQLGRHLLGKTIVVQDLRAGLSMSADDSDGHRFVTLAGEVIEPTGQISLGPPSSEAGLISRKSELRDIAQQLGETENRIETLSDQLHRADAEAAHIEEVQQELRGAVHDAQTTRVEANAALANIDEAVRRLTDEQPLIAGEVAMIQEQISEARRRHSKSTESLGHVEQENQRRESEVERHEQNIDEIVDHRTAIQEQLTEAKVLAGQFNEKRASTASAVLAAKRDIQAASDAVEAAQREADESRRRIAEAEEALRTSRELLAEAQTQGEQLETKAMETRRQREILRAESEQLSVSIKEIRNELEEAEGRLHAAELALQEARVRRDELIARVRDELDVDLVEQYPSYDHAERDWDEVETQIKELKGKIDRLGNVNLDAIDEQAELEERDTFLTTQRDDLCNSEQQIIGLITHLDSECVQRFTETFEQVRENFRELFRKLFGGGKADIVLEDPDNILECGIDIVARPPGKELQNIALMSGGEKTMTAIALLMAIFQSKPAPFALLDEVDAALDEANNERFNRIVQEFNTRSQFVVITHSKRTMTIADQLYGITMQEPGVSTRVSVKFESADGDDAESTAVA